MDFYEEGAGCSGKLNVICFQMHNSELLTKYLLILLFNLIMMCNVTLVSSISHSDFTSLCKV